MNLDRICYLCGERGHLAIDPQTQRVVCEQWNRSHPPCRECGKMMPNASNELCKNCLIRRDWWAQQEMSKPKKAQGALDFVHAHDTGAASSRTPYSAT